LVLLFTPVGPGDSGVDPGDALDSPTGRKPTIARDRIDSLALPAELLPRCLILKRHEESPLNERDVFAEFQN